MHRPATEHYAQRRLPDISTAKKILLWQPTVSYFLFPFLSPMKTLFVCSMIVTGLDFAAVHVSMLYLNSQSAPAKSISILIRRLNVVNSISHLTNCSPKFYGVKSAQFWCSSQPQSPLCPSHFEVHQFNSSNMKLKISNHIAVWFKLMVTVTEMTINESVNCNGNCNGKVSLTVTVTVTEIPVTETFS